VAWIIGWDLILEYAVSNMAVAVGFSAYVDSLLRGFGLELPRKLMGPMIVGGKATGAYFNLPGFLIVMALTVILVIGIRESAGANNLMVGVKLIAILIFLGAASRFIHVSNWQPFMPNGFQGVLTGGAIVFFTYIGFDSVSTAAEECRNPQKDVPFGIIASLVICAVLYVSVALVLTGIQHWPTLRNAAPVANALMAIGLSNVMKWVTVGALTGMLSSLLVFQLGQARVWFAMSRDGLLLESSQKSIRAFAPLTSALGWRASLWPSPPASLTSALWPTFPISGPCLPSHWCRWECLCSAALNPSAGVPFVHLGFPSFLFFRSSAAWSLWPACRSKPGCVSWCG